MIYSVMNDTTSETKQRRTFTLSPESIAYLEQEARRRRTNSHSAVLDELLREKKKEEQLAVVENQFTAYYDSLDDKEVEEQRTWGEYAGSHLALNEEELLHAQSTARGNLVHKTANRPSGKRKAAGSDRLRQRTKQSSAS